MIRSLIALASLLTGCAHASWIGTAPKIEAAASVEEAVMPLLERMPPGAERDVVVRTPAGRFAVELRRGHTPQVQAVPWPEAEVDSAAAARALLSHDERARIHEVAITAVGPGAGDQTARYVADGSRYRIEVFDRAFELDARLFCGPPTRPQPHSVRTVLHEVMHALQSYGRNRLRRRFRAVGGRSPTGLGEGIDEAMAESFSLYRCDPEALRRVAPRQWAWFERDGHLP